MNSSTPLRLLFVLALLPALNCTAAADDLGRLFTSTAERARLDNPRAARQESVSISDGSDRLVINGTLRGSDGKQRVWLNGAPVDSAHSKDVTLLRNGNVKLHWRDGEKTLKPGQGLDQTTGMIFDHITPQAAPPVTVADTVSTASPPAATTADPSVSDADQAVATEQSSADAKAK